MQDEMLLEIRVTIVEPVSVNGATRDIVMIPFTAEAAGPDFTGKTIGQSVDTQKISKDGSAVLSARYMLEGTDSAGNACRVFVENQGSWDTGFVPTIVTDSPILRGWETSSLYATAEGAPGGVLIRIFRKAD